MHYTKKDIRNLIGSSTVVNAETWRAIDRFLNKRYTSGTQEGKDEWLQLPRYSMAEGGAALDAGLMEYQAWVDKNLTMSQQADMLANIVLDEQEQASSATPISLGHLAYWLNIAAAEEGVSLEAFVINKLSWHANGRREAARKALVS